MPQKRSYPERRMSEHRKCKPGPVLSLEDLHVLTCALECTELVLRGKREGQCLVWFPRQALLLHLRLKVLPVLLLCFLLLLLTTSQQLHCFSG